MIFILAVLIFAALPSVGWAQPSGANSPATNLVATTIFLTPSNAALVADFQSNAVPLDSVITLGAKAALNQARGRLLDEVNHLSFDELAAAYPQLVPIIDSSSTPAIQLQQLRTLASMQLSKVKTPGDARRIFSLIEAAQDTVRRQASPSNSVSSNAPPQIQNPSRPGSL